MKHSLSIAIISLAVLPFFIIGQSVFCADQSTQEKKRPNILFILADDMRPDHTRIAGGNPFSRTPNLDMLASCGYSFSHCYCMGANSGAVCTPSRTMLLTGHSLFELPKVPGKAGGWQAGPASNTYVSLPKVLEQAAYETFYVGKPGNTFLPAIQEFNHIDTSIEHDEIEASKTDVNFVIDFLKNRDKEKPFFVHLAPPVPHDPRVSPPEVRALYTPENSPLPPSYMPIHPFNNGEMMVRDERLAPWPRTKSEIKMQVGDYMAAIANLDIHIGRLFAYLKETGQWDNTIIIFASDNGLSLGDHGLMGKQNLYEFGGMHVPLTIYGPGIPHGRSEALVYLLDLFPTLCEFANADLPQHLYGKSLIPLMDGKVPKLRDHVITAYKSCQRSIRDEHWQLIHYPQINLTQLFDLDNDPHELNDLADQPDQKERIAAMTQLLQKDLQELKDPEPFTVAHPKPAEWKPPAANKQRAKQKADNEEQ